MRLFRSTVVQLLGVAAACVVAATGCSKSADLTVAPPADSVATFVAGFNHLADSAMRAGGDSSIGAAYASMAEAVRLGGRISPIVISVDGVPTDFLATAQQTEIGLAAFGCPPGALCPVRFVAMPVRSLIAWQKSDPRKLVQLSSTNDADSIGAWLAPVLSAPTLPFASLLYLDGTGGAFFGTSGSQKFAVTVSTVPCTTSGQASTRITSPFVAPTCTQADFSISFSAKASPSSFFPRQTPATGTHSFAMATQPVLGARFELGVITIPQPPIIVPPSASLPATLAATVDSVVTLTLTVTNPGSTPVNVVFPSGQHYDFTISDTKGALLWRWGMGVMFTQIMSTQTLAPQGTLVFTAQWKPAAKGSFVATGSLVSASHHADAKAQVTVP